MKKKHWFLLVCLATIVLFLSTSLLYAGKRIILKKGVNKSSKTPKIRTSLPDLVVEKASWSKNPKEGDIVGASPILHITVLNKGTAPAGASKLKIDCKSLTSTNYPYPLSGMINIQPLGPKQSMTYAWPNISTEKWYAGTYKLDFAADHHFNLVNESNENNNTKTLTFTVLSKVDLLKRVKVRPESKPKLNTDLEVVSFSMTPTNPVAGQEVIFTAVVRNSGKVNTPQVNTLMTFKDSAGGGYNGNLFNMGTAKVPSLIPGQTFEFKAAPTFITFGENAAASVKVDQDNEFAEINEKNNRKWLYFNVQCKPELAPYEYVQGKPNFITIEGKKGEEFIATIMVYNNSWCTSNQAKLKITGPGISPTLDINLVPIKGHGKLALPVPFKFETASNYHCKIVIDSTNTNDESIENNNEITLIAKITE